MRVFLYIQYMTIGEKTLKGNSTNLNTLKACVHVEFYCICEKSSLKHFVAPEEAAYDLINNLQ